MRRRPTALLILAMLSFASVMPAQDSRPQLLSTKGGHGGSWPSIAALEKAAASGDPRACSDLGDMLATGTGMAMDVRRAVPLLERAAAAGQAAAAFRLGKLYESGDGVAHDNKRAFEYFRAAATGGVPEAYYNVGAAYASARGVKRDFVEGLAWMILATQNGAPDDGEKAVREQLNKMHKPELIAQGEARAKSLAAELAKSGRTATTTAGSGAKSAPPPRYVPGQALPLPAPSAGAPALTAPGQTTTTTNPEDGPPVKVISIFGQRLEWPSFAALQRAADHADTDALFALGQLLLEGDKLPPEVPPDTDRALGFLERAAAAGSTDAAFRLAEIYTNARKVPPDEGRAFKYTLQAAKAGARSAIFNLGAFYANGRGTKKDYTEALAWLLTAERYGASPAAAMKIRNYLKTAAPDQIPVAERRAEELKQSIDATRAN